MIVYPPHPMLWSAIVTAVHDGDTCTLDIDLGKYARGKDQSCGFHVYVEKNRLHIHNATRFYGINAPELMTPEGKVAQQALVAKMPPGTTISLATWLDQSDKYGRLLGRIVLADGTDINQWMVDKNYAAIYYGIGPKVVP